MSRAQSIRAYAVLTLLAGIVGVLAVNYAVRGGMGLLLAQVLWSIALVLAFIAHFRARDLARAKSSPVESTLSAAHPASGTMVPAVYTASNSWEVAVVEKELNVLTIDLTDPSHSPRKTRKPIKLVRAHWHDEFHNCHVLHTSLPTLGTEHDRACAIERALDMDVVNEPAGWKAIAEYFTHLARSTPSRGEVA